MRSDERMDNEATDVEENEKARKRRKTDLRRLR